VRAWRCLSESPPISRPEPPSAGTRRPPNWPAHRQPSVATARSSGSPFARRSFSATPGRASTAVASAPASRRRPSITSSQSPRGEQMTRPTFNASACHATPARAPGRTALCVECSKPVTTPPARGRPPALCLTCRVRRCKCCGRDFSRGWRSNKGSDAGLFCSRGCYYTWRRSNKPKPGGTPACTTPPP
jgi:hypothetical protein